MANPINDLMQDIKDKVLTVPAVADKVLTLYEQEDLLNSKKKIGLPAVGIIYVATRGSEDAPKTGLAAQAIFDIYIVGGDACKDPTEGLPINTLEILDSIRNAIKCTKPTGVDGYGLPQTGRKWQFVMEAPVDIGENAVGYVQRWKTTVVLT